MSEREIETEQFERQRARLQAVAYRMLGSRSEAEDAVQEAFARALNHARTFRNTDNPEAWLRVVAMNVARSRWSRVKRWTGLMPRLAGTTSYDDDSTPDRIALLEALKRLPAAQREAIVLHHLADLQVREIAAQLGVPSGTVKARLSRGRAALAALLGEEHSDISSQEVHDG